jgi:thioredoxin-like negative regulator of GroEL
MVIGMGLPLSTRWAAAPPVPEAESMAGRHGSRPSTSLIAEESPPTAIARRPLSEPSKGWPIDQGTTDARPYPARTADEKGRVADELVKIGTPASLQTWGQAVLSETDPEAIQAMMSALDNLNGEDNLEIVTQLVELSAGPEVFDGLARTLSRMANSDTAQYLAEIHAAPAVTPGQQERALRLLGAIANPEAVPGLAALLYQPDFGPAVTGQTAESLSKIGNPASVIALAGAVQTLPPEQFAQRQQALDALASTANPESAALLADLAANSPHPLIAAAARDALERLPARDTTAAPPPQTWLPSPEHLVGKAAPEER